MRAIVSVLWSMTIDCIYRVEADIAGEVRVGKWTRVNNIFVKSIVGFSF